MRFKKLVVKNFMSYRAATFDLSQRGVFLIEGKNGAGKSNLFAESLVWCLFGSTLKGVEKDGVVNDAVGKNCMVSIVFIVGNKKYKVVRYRKHHKHQNSVVLQIKSKDGWKPLHDQSIASVQGSIHSILGIDMYAFTNSIIFGQGNITRYVTATDAERKKILEEILMLTWIPAAYALAKKELTEAQSFLDSLQHDLSLLRHDRDAESLKLNEFKQIKKKQEMEKIIDAIECMESIVDANKKIQESEDALIPFEDDGGVVALRKKFNVETKKYKIMEAVVKGVEKDVSSYGTLKFIEIQKKKLNDELNALNKVPSFKVKCTKCNQILSGDVLKKYKAQQENKETLLYQEIKKFGKQYQDVKFYEREFEELSVMSYNVNDLRLKVHAAEKNMFRREGLYTLMTTAYAVRVKASKSIRKIRQRSFQGNDVIADLAVNLKLKREEIKKLKHQVEDQSELCKYLEFWKVALANQGIKSVVLADVMPFLNKRANYYADILTGGKICIKFTSHVKLQNGTTREKFDVIVSKQRGTKTYKGASGGEKKRADICTALALRDLVTARGSKACNLFVVDEAFESLDTEGASKVVDLLNDITKASDSVYVITHKADIAGQFSRCIIITNKNGRSKVMQ